MSIRLTLGITFAALTLAVMVLAGVSLKTLHDTDAQYATHFAGLGARGDAAEKFRRSVDERAIAIRNLTFVTEPHDVELERANVTQSHARVVAHLAAWKDKLAKATDRAPAGVAMLAEVDRIETAYAQVALSIFDLLLKDQRQEAIAKLNAECRPLLAALIKQSNDYAEVVQGRQTELMAKAAASFAFHRNALLGLCLLIIAFATTAAVLVTRRITRPIDEAVRLAEAVAAGDLSSGVESTGNDEIAKLLRALGRMGRNLSGIVASVRSSSDTIATGSAQIASGNADLSQRTEQQASALQQTAATMEQLGATVRHNADSAQHANRLAAGASAVACRGGEVVARVVTTMKGIHDSSRKIGDIIAVIDGIAFQTNILALNAAVEAARAGEQGRGFAVVASEVRSLAQRSAGAAKEIKALIEHSVEQVGQGTALVDQAGQTMDEIVGAIRRVTDIVAEITAAGVEQSSGVQQVGDAINRMDEATQRNAALVEQSAAAAEGLRNQARHLVDVVSVFRVSTVPHDAKPPVAPWPHRAAGAVLH